MAHESPVTSLNLFKEVRVDIKPGTFDTVIQFRPPASTSHTFTRTSLPKRLISKKRTLPKSEEDFTRQTLANESNVFFGRPGNYPRSFLWRTLNSRSVLQIQSVDLSKGSSWEADASLVLEFVFPGTIRPGCIAITETESEDGLELFVVTTTNDLYTLTLKRPFFYSAKASEGDIEKWCKVLKKGSLGFTTPYRLIARSSLELILGLSDGRLVRFTRRDGKDGSDWHDVVYSEGRWGSSLRGFVPWQGSNSITCNGLTLEKNTPQALALSPEGSHLWVVCLDHTLKAWDIEQKRTVYTNDLLGVRREPHETAKLLLDPSNSNLIQVFHAEMGFEGDQYYVMTFSPHELGQFKIRAIRDANAGNKGVRDLYSEDILRAPDPDPSPDSKAIWKMADFKVKTTDEGTLDIWLLMKSNRQYKLYNLQVPLEDFGRSLSPYWRGNWTTTALETLDSIPPPAVSDADAEDITESWAKYLFSSKNLPEELIKFALSNYANGQKLNVSTSSKSSLQERVEKAILSSVRLQRIGSNAMDFSGYRTSLEQEWALLWQEVQNTNNARWEVQALTYDIETGAPSLTFSGGYSLIRKCSKTEIVAHNDTETLKKSPSLLDRPSIEENGGEPVLPDELSIILETAQDFRRSFSHAQWRTCNNVLATELWKNPEYSAPLQIQSFYDRCQLEALNDNDVLQLKANLRSIAEVSGSGVLENFPFEAFLRSLPATRFKEQGLLSTSFGLGAIVRGAQEMINLHEQMLFDMLLLIVMVEVEVEEEDIRGNDFYAPSLYVELLQLLKQYQIMKWLAHNSRLEPLQASDNGDGNDSSREPSSARTSTVLQNLFALALNPRPLDGQSQINTLTLDIEDVLVWTTGIEEDVDFDDALAHIQCNLLANNDIDLASSFLHYQPSTPWATYLKGRLYLIIGEFAEAAIYFKKAAFNLSLETDTDYALTSSSLLSPAEAAHLGQGLPLYYTHIQNLFRSASCPSYVATFARLILQHLPDPSDQSNPLQSLFDASVSISDFQSAFSSLTRLPPVTASPLIPSFLTALLSQNRINTALALPWPPSLRPHIDTFLSSKAASTASSSGPQYYKLLASWRLHHHDCRGAAVALLAHLQRVRKSSKGLFAKGGETDEIIATYLNAINLLACVGEKEDEDAWVLTDAFGGLDGKTEKGNDLKKKKKRKVITIKDIRAAYQKELDRRSVLENGRWGFGFDGTGEEEMEVDGIEEDGMDVDGE